MEGFGRTNVRGGRSTRGSGRGIRVLSPRGKFSGGSTVKRSSSDGHIQSDGSGPSRLNSGRETGRDSAIKQTRNVDNENPLPMKQRLIFSSTPPEENISFNMNFGNCSYENSGEDEFEDVVDTRRILLHKSEDEDKVEAVEATFCLKWPHSVCTSPRCHSATSRSTPTPEPMPESGLKPEPDIKPKTEPTLATGKAKVRGGRGTRGRGRGKIVLTPRGKFGGDSTVKRLSSDGISCRMMVDMPETEALEKSVSPKKPRRFKHQGLTPARYIKSDESKPSTLNSGKETGRDTAIKRTRDDDNENPPPAKQRLYIKSEESKPSTLNSGKETGRDTAIKRTLDEENENPPPAKQRLFIQSDESKPSTLNSFKETGRDTAIKRTPDVDNVNPPPSKQRLISSSTSSPHKPLKENEILNMNLGYSSEEDSGEEGDEVVDIGPISVPRAARMLLDVSEDEDEMQAVDATLCLQWPPQPYSSPRCHSAASHSPPTPEPITESGSKPEPDITSKTELTLMTDSVVPFEPTNKFNFMWRAFPQIQIEPNLRRETFSDINCGPTAKYANPYEAFTAIWDRKIMEHIAAETNRYAKQLQTVMEKNGTLLPNSRIRRWRDTDANELYIFFAVMIATGLVVKSRVDDYWSCTFETLSTPGFSSLMAYNRFMLLEKCLHFQDNNACNPKSMTRPEVKLYKIKPILDHLNNKFATLYNMSQNVALDESLTMWKGWLDINQFIHNKAASVGIKTYEVCESQTGYLWRFEVHAGHTNASSPQDDDPVSGIVPSLVMRLLNGLEHKGHTIWMDNYYNSPVLARELKTRGFDCVGTLRTNRKFVPQEIQNLRIDEMAFGQVFGCTSGDVDLVVWRDKKRVALISTYHGLATVKCSDALKPSIIPDYNLCMGGVDRKDQMLAAYPIERKRTRVWYKKFFKRLLNASVLNAYILLRSQHTITHNNFRKTLVSELILKHSPPTPKASLPSSLLRSSGRCVPAQYDFVGCNQHQRPRRQCVVCKKRTFTYCKGCNVPLCVFTCFEPHHYR